MFLQNSSSLSFRLHKCNPSGLSGIRSGSDSTGWQSLPVSLLQPHSCFVIEADLSFHRIPNEDWNLLSTGVCQDECTAAKIAVNPRVRFSWAKQAFVAADSRIELNIKEQNGRGNFSCSLLKSQQVAVCNKCFDGGGDVSAVFRDISVRQSELLERQMKTSTGALISLILGALDFRKHPLAFKVFSGPTSR